MTFTPRGISHRATQLEVPAFSSSEGWIFFFKYSYHSLAECLCVLFTKKLVGLFDLAHVRSLIIFFLLFFAGGVCLVESSFVQATPLESYTSQLTTVDGRGVGS